MQYFKVTTDIYIEYDSNKSRATVLSKKALLDQKASCEERLAELPTDLSDKDLLAWAKENYPPAEHIDEVAKLEAEILEIDMRLAEMK